MEPPQRIQSPRKLTLRGLTARLLSAHTPWLKKGHTHTTTMMLLLPKWPSYDRCSKSSTKSRTDCATLNEPSSKNARHVVEGLEGGPVM